MALGSSCWRIVGLTWRTESEKDNAEVRVEQVSEYQAIVDAEWQIIYQKLEALYQTGAKVVLSKLPIGDLATQYVPPMPPLQPRSFLTSF